MLRGFPNNLVFESEKNLERPESCKEIYQIIESDSYQAEQSIPEAVPVISENKPVQKPPDHKPEARPQKNP